MNEITPDTNNIESFGGITCEARGEKHSQSHVDNGSE